MISLIQTMSFLKGGLSTLKYVCHIYVFPKVGASQSVISGCHKCINGLFSVCNLHQEWATYGNIYKAPAR